MIESTCPHKWDFRSYGTCPMCLKDMQNRHSPNYISTEMLRRIEHLSYTNDLPSRYVRMMASELLSLRQQIGQRQAELEFIMQKNMEAAKQEPAQAVPYAWHVPPMVRMYFGKFAQIDAESEARHVGGTAKAIALYTAPPAIDDETKPLTDEHIDNLLVAHGKGDDGFHSFARAIEKAHGIKEGK